LYRYDEANQYLGTVTPMAYFLTLSFARNIADVADFGVTLSQFKYAPELFLTNMRSFLDLSAILVDVGAFKTLALATSSVWKQSVDLGVSVKNITGSKVDLFDVSTSIQLPVQLKLGGTYKIEFMEPAANQGLKPFEALATIEYQDFLNYSYRSGFHSGIEVVGFEIVAVRLGYYNESLDNIGFAGNKSEFSEITYGIGLSLPLGKLTNGKVPLRVSFDYANMKQLSYSNLPIGDYGSFNSLSCSCTSIFDECSALETFWIRFYSTVVSQRMGI
jgi:hypothetical protein